MKIMKQFLQFRIVKMNSEGFFMIRFKEINYLSNKIITNDTLLIRNLNLNNFIKFNQSVKSRCNFIRKLVY